MILLDGHQSAARPLPRRALLRSSVSAVGLGALGALGAACSGGKGLPSKAADGDGDAQEPARLQLMTNHTAEEAKWFQQAIDKFSEKNPDIGVKLLNIAEGQQYYTKLKTAAIGHTMPDVFYVRTLDVASNAAKKWQIPLTDYIAKDAAEVNVGDFSLGIVNFVGEQSQNYALMRLRPPSPWRPVSFCSSSRSVGSSKVSSSPV